MLKDITAKIPSMHWSSSLKELAILLNADTRNKDKTVIN
jgi:hypothetical protein